MLDFISQINFGPGQNNLISILLFIVLTCIFIILFLTQKIAFLRKKKLSKNKTEDALKDFFSSQIYQTQNTTRHKKRSHFKKKIMRLRHAYLAIERNCLDRGIDSQEYWELLHSKLRKLLAIYEKNKSNGIIAYLKKNIELLQSLLDRCPESKGKDQVKAALKNLVKTCESMEENPERLSAINRKVLKLLEKFSNELYRETSYISDSGENYIANTHHTVSKIKGHIDAIKSISNDKTKNQEEQIQGKMTTLSDTSQAMKGRIKELEDNLKYAQLKLTSHMSEYEQSGYKDTENLRHDIHDISEEIIEASEREIGRLNKLLDEKRNIINELEESLKTIKPSSDSGKPESHEIINLSTQREEDIAFLKRNLQESEQCICLLEGELETLKTRTREAGDLKSTPINENEINELTKTVNNLKMEIVDYESAWKEKNILVSYVLEFLDASTTEDVSLSIYQCLLEMGFSSNILVYTPERTLEINEVGAIASKDKLLVNSMQIGEVNPSSGDKRLHFRWQHIGGIIRREDSNAITEKEKENLVELSHLTDKIIHRILQAGHQKQNKRSLESVCNSIKYLTRELDESFEQVFSKVEGKVHDGFGQLQDVARSSGVNAAHIASIKKLEASVSEEIIAEKRIKLRMHKSMLSLLQKVEKL